MRFDCLLSRADEEVLQILIGQGPLRLAALLDRSLLSPAKQRELLLRLRKPQELLTDAVSRKALLPLLRPEEARSLCAALGLSPNDPYHALSTVTARGHTQREILLSYFELAELEELRVESVAPIEPGVAGYPLFSYQRVAARAITSKLAVDPYRSILHMPTGSGKTRTAMHIIAEHLSSREGAVVLWLAHSEELCDQAAQEFLKAWSFLGNREVSLMRYWGSQSADPLSITEGLIVAGLQKVVQTAKRDIPLIGRLGSRLSLVVLDEAHQAVAPTYRMILQALVDPYPKTALLGLTATPGRTWSDVSADEELAEFFGRQKVTLQIPGYANPVDYLISEGYLARADFRPLFYNPGIELTDEDVESIEENLDLPRRVLEMLEADQKRNLKIVTEIEKLAARHKRIVVFALSMEHSDILAAVLQARGYAAYSVTSRTPSDERKRLLEEYKGESEEVRILCNYGVLTTGFDAPKTSCAVIARPTTSLVLFSQMVGRAIRGPKAGGNMTAEIVTVTDQGLPGFGDVSNAFYNWEDIWEDPIK